MHMFFVFLGKKIGIDFKPTSVLRKNAPLAVQFFHIMKQNDHNVRQ